MSMQAMNAFLEKAEADEAVAARLVAILDENEAAAIPPKVVELANDNGFEVTAVDVEETRARFVKAIKDSEREDGDLSDDDLEHVSGGVSPALINGLIKGAGLAIKVGGKIGSAIIGRGINKTVDDVGNFFSKW
ncbi:Nif11-like leader peptide family RiPP precursor [Nisaea sp.]|uniref:Nif11-like leader peptide family RiPP precursor n=1 Tax=Nisaea sp. TaxID=2024842 RepID=UPI003B519316